MTTLKIHLRDPLAAEFVLPPTADAVMKAEARAPGARWETFAQAAERLRRLEAEAGELGPELLDGARREWAEAVAELEAEGFTAEEVEALREPLADLGGLWLEDQLGAAEVEAFDALERLAAVQVARISQTSGLCRTILEQRRARNLAGQARAMFLMLAGMAEGRASLPAKAIEALEALEAAERAKLRVLRGFAL